MTDIAALADEPFVSLTTFRRSGEPVATPLWVVPADGGVAFWTDRGSGKVKRLRNNAAVELRPCSRRGTVAPNAPVALGNAEVAGDPGSLQRIEDGLRAKYGLQYRVVRLIERLRPGPAERVVITVRTR